MKNIHLLPTDKASRLWLDSDNKLWIHEIPTTLFMMQNIYITSDEKIKDGDWCFNPKTNKSVKVGHHGHYGYSSKKIILTTDPTLIADGVQSIDDEFLQWFVKNPSCEKVETICGLFNPMGRQVDPNNLGQNHSQCIWKHKIITSQEEPKQHVEYINNNIEEFEGKLKEFKQVTSIDWLEKQLDNNDFSNHQMEVNISMSLPKYIEIFKQSKEMYNQERMYSEEDLKQSYSQGWMTRERFDDLSPEIVYPDGLDYEEKQEYAFNLWFNQFKKK
jgi:hypothetical protein